LLDTALPKKFFVFLRADKLYIIIAINCYVFDVRVYGNFYGNFLLRGLLNKINQHFLRTYTVPRIVSDTGDKITSRTLSLLRGTLQPGTSGSHLKSYLLQRQRSGRLWLEASLGKLVMRSYLQKKNTHQKKKKRASGVAQGGVGPEFRPQYCKKGPHRSVGK
jgi:hypothetical protein